MELVKVIFVVLLRVVLGISLLIGPIWSPPAVAVGACSRTAYDAENRLIQVVSGGITTTFTYDGDSRRVKQTDGRGVTLYVGPHYQVFIPAATPAPPPSPTPTPRLGFTPKVYLPGALNCYYAIEGRPAQVTRYYFAGDRRIALRRGCSDQVAYLYGDHLGSTLATSDGESSRYWPYGAPRLGAVGTAYRFTSQRLDDSTGLYYYGARYYDPVLGRFVQADTVVPQSGNPQAARP